MTKVLFLEPDKTLGTLYTEAATLSGLTAMHCRGAQKAIEYMDSFMPDIVVTELRMIAHDGIEFLQELRSYPEWLGLPVIILTDVAPQVLHPLRATLCADFGVQGCLYKPRTTLQQLIAEISAAVRAHANS